MITGFNTNVRHGGRVFHVQTEDSGRNHPHVISHLYFGGTILASEKRDYGDLLDAEDVTSAVRGLMEEQHRKMLACLKRGEFDVVIAERLDDPSGDTGEQGAAAEAAEAPPLPETVVDQGDPRAFGEGVVSQKPLDEVILEYLVEKARTRTGAAGARPARTRSRE